MPDSKTEAIVCPHCGAVQEAEIVWPEKDPWPQYAHVCSACGYIITESEWSAVNRPTPRAADSPTASR
ncbi:MAG TPA: hypothetical protein ENJ54_01095 [Chloroflexi bacterium]|nr:hypothetical protein [Chloroflexota bacterium]